ncbi:MAG: chloride channel protein [Clostridiales bacterium]|nr:chloride channel protein [Clostridiales bacterium]
MLRYLSFLLKWLVIALLVGAVGGAVGTVFHLAVSYSADIRAAYPKLILLLPLAGAAIAFMYKLAGMADDGGTDLVFTCIRTSEKLPVRMAPLIFVSTVLTHLCGGSSGREGAALQIGGSIGELFSNLFRTNDKDKRILIMCGMSALFSALFGTPLTAAVFGMEVISIGVMYYAAIVPCLFASIVAYFIASSFGVDPTRFSVPDIPLMGAKSLGQVLLLSAACAVMGVIFCCVMHGTKALYSKLLKNTVLRATVGGLIVAGLSLLINTDRYNGSGIDTVYEALSGDVPAFAFALKLVFTALTLGAGFKGGEIVPTFFIGSTFGNTVGRLLKMSPQFGGAIGLVAAFCSAVNCPVSSMLLSIELFSSEGMLFFAAATAVSYTLSGRYSLYRSQKIVYSKLEPSYVNLDTK